MFNYFLGSPSSQPNEIISLERIRQPVISSEQQETINQLYTLIQNEEIFQNNQDRLKRYLTTSSLHRYLRARSFDLENAKNMILNSIDWFLKSEPDKITPEEVEEEAKSGRIRCPTLDRHGRPVIVLDTGVSQLSSPRFSETDPSNDSPNSPPTTDFKLERDLNSRSIPCIRDLQTKLLVFTLERATNLLEFENNLQNEISNNSSEKNLPVEKIVLFVRLENFSPQRSPSIQLTCDTILTVMNHFPERLGHCIMFQSGWLFSTVWSAVSALMDPNTREKIIFIQGDYSEGSDNDLYLKNLISDDWKSITGVDQPSTSPEVSSGYDHNKYWNEVKRQIQTDFQNLKK